MTIDLLMAGARRRDMAAGDNKVLVRRFYDVFYNGRDQGAIEVFFAADYVHHPADLPSRRMDYGEFRNREVKFLNAFPDLVREIDDEVSEGDRVAVRSLLTGTQKGDLPSLPARGKKIEVRSIVIYRIADGKIAEGWECYDSLSMMMQLDVIHKVSTLSKGPEQNFNYPPIRDWPE